jgi:hypothetical protein
MSRGELFLFTVAATVAAAAVKPLLMRFGLSV